MRRKPARHRQARASHGSGGPSPLPGAAVHAPALGVPRVGEAYARAPAPPALVLARAQKGPRAPVGVRPRTPREVVHRVGKRRRARVPQVLPHRAPPRRVATGVARREKTRPPLNLRLTVAPAGKAGGAARKPRRPSVRAVPSSPGGCPNAAPGCPQKARRPSSRTSAPHGAKPPALRDSAAPCEKGPRPAMSPDSTPPSRQGYSLNEYPSAASRAGPRHERVRPVER
jgi:hypothetical protein